MTGRSLHDALLRVLGHGPLRAQLFALDGDTTAFSSDEWHILRRVPSAQLRNMARFLARHYYQERVVRLFRHIRRLAAQTGRDPLLVLDTPPARAVLDQAILGSPDTADAMVSLIETFLLENAHEIQMRFPYWQDLIRYQATMFRLEARREDRWGTCLPCRSASANIVHSEWDLPKILADLPSLDDHQITNLHSPSLLLVALSVDGQVTSLRCTPNVQCLFEAADGTRTIEELGMVAEFSARQTEQILEQMRGIGAIHWKASITAS